MGRWAAIAISDHHTAGLSSEGQLFTWGANHRGQLGHGDKSPGALDTPVLVNAIADVEVKYAGICAANGNGCCFVSGHSSSSSNNSSWSAVASCLLAVARHADCRHCICRWFLSRSLAKVVPPEQQLVHACVYALYVALI